MNRSKRSRSATPKKSCFGDVSFHPFHELKWRAGLISLFCCLFFPLVSHAQPPNDNFDNASPIPATASGLLITGDNQSATSEIGEPAHAGLSAQASLWWRWQPAYEGSVTIGFGASSPYRRVGIYSGQSLQTLSLETNSARNTFKLRFFPRRGETYHFAFDRLPNFSGQTIPFQWTLDQENVQLRPVENTVVAGSPVSLGVQFLDPEFDCQKVEYLIDGERVGVAVSAPWEITWIPSKAAAVTLTARAITTSGVAYLAMGEDILVFSPNDNFSDAASLDMMLEGTNFFSGVTGKATAEVGEPNHGGEPASQSLWWRWRPSWNGGATLFLKNFRGVHLAAVYRGQNVLDLIPESSSLFTNDFFPGVGKLSWEVTAGETYWVAIDNKFPNPEARFEATLVYVTLSGEYTGIIPAATFPVHLESKYFGESTNLSAVTFQVAQQICCGEFGPWITAGRSESAPFAVDWRPETSARFSVRAIAETASGRTFSSEEFQINVAPASDRFAGAQQLPEDGSPTDLISGRFDNPFGGSETEEPAHGGVNPLRTQWWKWTSASTGLAEFSSLSGRVSAAIYKGSELANLKLIADSRRAGVDTKFVYRFQFLVAEGQTYYLAMGDQPDTNTFDFLKSWSISTYKFFVAQPTYSSQWEVGQPLTILAKEMNPAVTHSAPILHLSSSGSAQWLEISLPQPALSTTWTPNFPGPWRIWVQDGLVSTPVSTIYVKPVNDQFTKAEPLQPAGCAWTTTGSTGGATFESGENNENNEGNEAEGSVWCKWTPSWTGRATPFLRANATTPMNIFVGDGISSLRPLDQSITDGSFPVSEEVPVYFQLLSVGGQHIGGGYQLDIYRSVENGLFETSLRLPAPQVRETWNQVASGNFRGITPSGQMWWDWTAPLEGDVWIEAGGNLPYSLEVFKGDNTNNFALAGGSATSFPIYPARFRAEAGVTYHLNVLSGSREVTNCDRYGFVLSYYPMPLRPPNDDFANRMPIIGEEAEILVSSEFASLEPFEIQNIVPGIPETAPSASLWWVYRPSHDGILSVDFSPDQVHQVRLLRSGVEIVALSKSGDLYVTNAEEIIVRVVESRRVSRNTMPPLPVHFSLHSISPPINDDLENRLRIRGSTFLFSTVIDGATLEAKEARGAGELGSLWWEFIADRNGVLDLALTTSFTGQLSVYKGNSYASLSLISQGNSPRSQMFPVKIGETYSIRVSSLDRRIGTCVLSGEFVSSADNDDFTNRKIVDGWDVASWGFLLEATMEAGEPAHATTAVGGSLWWQWTAPTNGILEISQPDPRFHVVTVYTGPTLPTLVPLPRRPGPAMGFEVDAGRTYVFAVRKLIESADDLVSLKFSFRYAPNGGQLKLLRRRSDGRLDWVHTAERGFSFTIQRRKGGAPWTVFRTNVGGTNVFTDSMSPPGEPVFYRALRTN